MTLIFRVLPIFMAVVVSLAMTTPFSVCWSISKVAEAEFTISVVVAVVPRAVAVIVTLPFVAPATVVVNLPLESVVPDACEKVTLPVPD